MHDPPQKGGAGGGGGLASAPLDVTTFFRGDLEVRGFSRLRFLKGGNLFGFQAILFGNCKKKFYQSLSRLLQKGQRFQSLKRYHALLSTRICTHTTVRSCKTQQEQYPALLLGSPAQDRNACTARTAPAFLRANLWKICVFSGWQGRRGPGVSIRPASRQPSQPGLAPYPTAMVYRRTMGGV